MTTETATRKIGRNKGKPRLWIEGSILDRAGFAHGTEWQLLGDGSDEYGITLQTSEVLEVVGVRVRRVAGTPARPIIDIAGATLGSLGNAESVTLEFEPGQGLITVKRNVGESYLDKAA